MKVRVLSKTIEDALVATGLPWSVEEGTKHYRVMLAGRQACVVSKGGKARARGGGLCCQKNARTIRRMAAGIKGEAA